MKIKERLSMALPLKKLNPLGIAHYLIPVAVFVLVGVGGGAYLLRSHAASSFPNCTQRGTSTITTRENNGYTSTQTEPYFQTLGNGSSGGCVNNLQTALNRVCSNSTKLAVDSQYGPKTSAAVTAVQRWLGYPTNAKVTVNGAAVSVDGAVGPQTWGLIMEDGSGFIGVSNINLNC